LVLVTVKLPHQRVLQQGAITVPALLTQGVLARSLTKGRVHLHYYLSHSAGGCNYRTCPEAVGSEVLCRCQEVSSSAVDQEIHSPKLCLNLQIRQQQCCAILALHLPIQSAKLIKKPSRPSFDSICGYQYNTAVFSSLWLPLTILAAQLTKEFKTLEHPHRICLASTEVCFLVLCASWHSSFSLLGSFSECSKSKHATCFPIPESASLSQEAVVIITFWCHVSIEI